MEFHLLIKNYPAGAKLLKKFDQNFCLKIFNYK